jgi:hypothetical protein
VCAEASTVLRTIVKDLLNDMKWNEITSCYRVGIQMVLSLKGTLQNPVFNNVNTATM